MKSGQMKPAPNEEKNETPSYQPATPFVETAVRLGVLGLLLYWSLTLVQPFISIFFWSVILTVALYPAYERLTAWLQGKRRLAAILITILNLFFVIGPAAWLALGLIDSFKLIAGGFDPSMLAIPAPSERVKSWPLIGQQVYQFWEFASTNTADAIIKIAPQLKPLGGSLLSAGAETGIGIIKFLIAIIIAGFLFPVGPSIANVARVVGRRLNSERGAEFIDLAISTIRAVSRGVIGISVLQACLAGIGFSAGGIPQASLLTLSVLILGIIQVGPSIVIIPVIIWSWTRMEFSPALMFTVYMIVVNLLDNLLKPFVMGRGLTTPMLVILVGVFGGVLSHGIMGLFLGPIILAVIWELLYAWARKDVRPSRDLDSTSKVST